MLFFEFQGTLVLLGIHIYKAPIWLDRIQKEHRRRKDNKLHACCLLQQIVAGCPAHYGTQLNRSIVEEGEHSCEKPAQKHPKRAERQNDSLAFVAFEEFLSENKELIEDAHEETQQKEKIVSCGLC